MTRYSPIGCTLVLLALASYAPAAQIAVWDLHGLNGRQAASPPSTMAPHVTASLMVRGAGLTTNTAPDAFGTNGWESAAQAPGSDEYVEWGFDVDPGYQVNLDQLLFKIRTITLNGAVATMGIYTSLDGYVAPAATFGTSSTADEALDLSGLPPVTGAFRVRLYEIGNAISGNTRIWESQYDPDDPTTGLGVQFTGSVTVPEPAAGVLLICSAASMVALRRR